jgi:hypothetical protein
MKSLRDLLNDWNGTTQRVNNLLNKDLPRIIGNESVRAVKNNFKLQGYDSGMGVATWAKRKASTDKAYDRGKAMGKNGKLSKYRSGNNKTYKGSVYQSTNPINLQTRNLFNGVKYTIEYPIIIIGVNTDLVPYTEYVNEVRQYIPKPDEPPNMKILKAIKKKYEYERDKAFKGFTK